MNKPPETLDGARVLAFASIDDSVVPTRNTIHRVGGEVVPPAVGLAIAQFQGIGEFYLFHCDADWRVVADTCHPTRESAGAQAEFEYRGVSARWTEVPIEKGWLGS